MACNDDEKKWYDTIPRNVVKVDVQSCCLELKKTIIRTNIDPSSTKLCTIAAYYWHFDCLKFAHQVGYAYDASIVAFCFRLNSR